MRRLAPFLVGVLAVAGCGGESEGPRLTVSAASSLKKPLTDYGEGFDRADVRLSFGPSDLLAAQIRGGVRPDVYAAANTQLPDELFAAGLVERPVRFAANRLVVAVPGENAKVKRFEDLARRGVRIGTGSPSVPIGAYTNQVLGRIPLARRSAFVGNLRSREPDVSAVVAKVAQGVIDAGFVYITDVEAMGGRLKAIEIPKRLRPQVAYAAAVVRGTEHPDEATRFVRDLVSGDGAAALRRAGFEPPP